MQRGVTTTPSLENMFEKILRRTRVNMQNVLDYCQSYSLYLLSLIFTIIFIQALDKCRSEVRKLQKKTQKASNEKYLEREQKSTEELGQLQRALLAFRSHGLRKVIIQHGDNMKGVLPWQMQIAYCPGFSSALVIHMLCWRL